MSDNDMTQMCPFCKEKTDTLTPIGSYQTYCGQCNTWYSNRLEYYSDFENVIIYGNKIESVKGPVNVITPNEIRCSVCDHTAYHHSIYGGCDWGSQKGYSEYSCNCGLRKDHIFRQYDKKLEYTFDLL